MLFVIPLLKSMQHLICLEKPTQQNSTSATDLINYIL